jgi:hypothetical protein
VESVGFRVLLASVAFSFAAGFGMAWLMKPDAAADAVVLATQAAPPAVMAPVRATDSGGSAAQNVTVPAAAAKAMGVDELWAKALLPQEQQQGFAAEDKLRQLVQSDPVALRKLMQRYDSASTPQERDLLKSVLATVQTPEVIAFSTRLAGSLNVAERKYGLEMLQQLAPATPETRSMIRRTLATEQSPEVLAQALATLQTSVADPEETEAIVVQLKALAQHADPAVRSASIYRLAQWDKTGQGGDRLAQALTDRAPDVRQAAIFAIGQNGSRSDALKAALIAVVNNAQESKDVRGSALQVLERFALTKEEYASLAQSRARITGM